MTTHDQFFKQLLPAFFDDLCTLFLPELGPHVRGDPRFLSGELSLPRPSDGPPRRHPRRADLVAELRGEQPHQRGLLHAEIERRYRGDVPRRMWEYASLLALKHGWPVGSLAIFLSGGPRGGLVEESYERSLWGMPSLQLRYKALYLEKMDPEPFLRHRQPLAPALAALMKGGRWSPVRHKLECLRRIARVQGVDRTHRDLLVECAETYIPLSREERVEFEELWRKETTMALPGMMYSTRLKLEARNEGREEGREEGRREGRQEGRREGAERLLLRQLKLRFGNLGDDVRARVAEVASVEELERLGERVLTASSLAEMGLD